MKFKLLLLVAALMLSAATVKAQSPNSISVNMVPPYPAPYENVSITLKSYTHNLDSALITWLVNGKTGASGTGKKSFSVSAPGGNAETTVAARIYLPEGPIEKKITIRPSVMVLLWQANDSYVPPFYRGKALPTPDSEIKVVAMPEIRTGGAPVDSKNMTYAWKQDYTNNVDGSGYGKNFFIYTSDYLDDSSNISVRAMTLDEQYSNQASINIGTAQPKILFYRSGAEGTVWERALSNPHKIQGSETIEAIPYFISPKEMQHPALSWNWFINGGRVNSAALKKNSMPLLAAEGTHGTSKLRLEIENREKIFQSTEKEINIEF